MNVPLRKVTARVDLKAADAYPPSQPRSRPGSPTKQSPKSSLFPPSSRPKVKVNSAATVRKLSSSSSLGASQANNGSASSRSRPGSPLRPSRMLTNESELGSSPKARITARPTPRSVIPQANLGSLEPRQRALTSASVRLELPPSEDRPRSGSVVALHHALSVSDLNPSLSPTPSQPSHPAEPPFIDLGGTNTPPLLAPIKIKSKVTGFVKATPSPTGAGDLASRSLSPPYATTRPMHARARTSSISSYSLNDPAPSIFYPITTASPAANPHRYAFQRAPSPFHTFPSPIPSSDPHPTKKSPLVPKVDPTIVPLPPHSPPVSALSISSKSSVSKTSTSLNNDQSTDNQVSSVVSHIQRRSAERNGSANPFLPQVDTTSQARRDRSHSRERRPRDLVHRDESDAESEGSERQLRAEAKTNRKIADLEITNRSLLAINTSLETTKSRQAKEIRDLRRKLRESRLVLPPRTYKAVESAMEEERDRDDGEEDGSDIGEGTDEAFQRVRTLIDSLIESGKRALETRPEDLRASLATKVLNADELRSWRDSGQLTSMSGNSVDKQDVDDETMHSHVSPALAAVPDGGNTSAECDREQASGSRGSSALPPITITHSP